ncbi:type II toxin-antitoxin system CcdA family antitoxin [Streptomyces sp. NPDC006339]|uniref:type II toxin-antitoxin system CcdA family antitoxin n=1 Tax=Streptomyces sp. NPDC006339 TaxID=3156755 RepID=UPI0033A8426B
MTTTKRITVTLPADILTAIQSEAGGNVSAYTAKALKAQAVRDAADRLSAWQAGRAEAIEDLEELAFDTLDGLPGGGQ